MSIASLREAIQRELQDVDALKELSLFQFMALMEVAHPDKVIAARLKVEQLLREAKVNFVHGRGVPHS